MHKEPVLVVSVCMCANRCFFSFLVPYLIMWCDVISFRWRVIQILYRIAIVFQWKFISSFHELPLLHRHWKSNALIWFASYLKKVIDCIEWRFFTQTHSFILSQAKQKTRFYASNSFVTCPSTRSRNSNRITKKKTITKALHWIAVVVASVHSYY